jgi:alkyl sulfatase BDS1-like metallo-beta-lactamase superfamily hydrolase
LTTVETASAAMALVRRHLGDKPVVAVIYSHSHADHFGGVAGVTSAAAVAAGQVAIIAPEHFLEHAVGENIIAGPAMSRRAGFQFGAGLEPGPLGTMTSGIGRGIPQGTLSLIAPTREIRATGETMDIDGVRLEFQMTPGTEAPAEMNFYLPQFRALFMAENANATLHNILTPRGALVRDAKIWADGLTLSLRLYGNRSDILFTGHAWPRFGQERIAAYLADHRDLYKFLHDQSVRLMNEGLTGPEIAEQIALPEALSRRWYNRGYYGTLRHNSRAVYQRYMGWYDGNPARLNPLPPEAAAVRYVAAMGGMRRVKSLARQAIAAGDYRWAAELLDRAVFAAPNDAQAREMLADVHRQLAYQSESAIWRNMYLRAAAELAPDFAPARTPQTTSLDLIRATPTPMLFDLLAVQIEPARAAGPPVTLAFVFPERNERVLASLRNGVLVHEHGVSDAADVTVTLPRAALLMGLLAGGTLPPGAASVQGDGAALRRFMGAFKAPSPGFAIVTP